MQIVSKTGFDISYKLSPLETVCMKCQIMFSGENKNIPICRLLKIFLRMLSIRFKTELSRLKKKKTLLLKCYGCP